MATENKIIVSPFEFAIASIADPEAAKNMIPENAEQKEERLTRKFADFISRVKTINPNTSETTT